MHKILTINRKESINPSLSRKTEIAHKKDVISSKLYNEQHYKFRQFLLQIKCLTYFNFSKIRILFYIVAFFKEGDSEIKLILKAIRAY